MNSDSIMGEQIQKMLSFFFFANKTTIFRPILTYTPHFHPLRSNKRRVDKVMPHIKALRVNPPLVFPIYRGEIDM